MEEKPAREFVFTDSDLAGHLDQDYPIKLTKLQDLIERVASRYPLIEKMEVSRIIKAIFESLRELLVLGCNLNFEKIFHDMKLNFHRSTYNSYQVWVSLITSPILKAVSDDTK
jgi:hypothetical protein